jgi:hypothetical protein
MVISSFIFIEFIMNLEVCLFRIIAAEMKFVRWTTKYTRNQDIVDEVKRKSAWAEITGLQKGKNVTHCENVMRRTYKVNDEVQKN